MSNSHLSTGTIRRPQRSETERARLGRPGNTLKRLLAQDETGGHRMPARIDLLRPEDA